MARQAIREFVEAIARHEPHTFYEAYEAADGVSFLHLMAFPDEAAEKNHQTAPHAMKFVESLYPRCEVQPAFAGLALVRSTAAGA